MSTSALSRASVRLHQRPQSLQPQRAPLTRYLGRNQLGSQRFSGQKHLSFSRGVVDGLQCRRQEGQRQRPLNRGLNTKGFFLVVVRAGSDVAVVEVPTDNTGVVQEVEARLRRLEVLVLLRRLYRDVIQSERILDSPLPMVKPDEDVEAAEQSGKRWNWGGLRGWSKEEGSKEWTVRSPFEVLEYAEDIQELAVALQRDMRGLNHLLSVVFPEDGSAEQTVKDTVGKICEKLEKHAARVEGSLSPADLKQAQAEQQEKAKEEQQQGQVLRRLRMEGLPNTSAVLDRFVQRLSEVDLNTVVRTKDGRLRISELDLPTLRAQINSILGSIGNVWARLNGTARKTAVRPITGGLPIPVPAPREEFEAANTKLILEVESLDKKLREVSRERESRLRARDVLARTRLTSEIRQLGGEVDELQKRLAVRRLQLEMDLIYHSLEEEVLQISEDIRTDEEESLLVAEFGLLDAELAKLRTAVDQNEVILIEDEDLAALATDIPDLKTRLGIQEEAKIPLKERVSLAVQESKGKVVEGSLFYIRGLRLLAGDVKFAARMFVSAVQGTTLKPREVQTLRRTFRDLCTLVPFTIILIIPLTPVGHVAIFSFLQRYFPGFFPSSFTNKRQEVMLRYEQLRKEMQLAATEREREEVAAMIAAVAQETYEASEDDLALDKEKLAKQQASGRGLLLGRGRKPSSVSTSVARVREANIRGESRAVEEGLRSLKVGVGTGRAVSETENGVDIGTSP